MVIGTTIGQPIRTQDDPISRATAVICTLRAAFEGPTEEQILLELQNSGYTPAVIYEAFLRANAQCSVPGQHIPLPPPTSPLRVQPRDKAPPPATTDEEKKFPWKVVGFGAALVVILGGIFLIARSRK
jgi:hypothetical protein